MSAERNRSKGAPFSICMARVSRGLIRSFDVLMGLRFVVGQERWQYGLKIAAAATRRVCCANVVRAAAKKHENEKDPRGC